MRRIGKTWAVALFTLCGCYPAVAPTEKEAAVVNSNHILQPDSNGNMVTSTGLPGSVSVAAGDTITFSSLTPADNIIEIGSASLTSDELCGSSDLHGLNHRVPAQNPTPAGLYAHNELSGPYHTYPAGLYVLSVGTDECRRIEKTTPCLPPNEFELGVALRPGSSPAVFDYLCGVTPYLMRENDPSKEKDPLTENTQCLRGQTLDTTWADPAVQGVFVRLAWDDINDAFRSYKWDVLDHELLQAVRYGKTVTIGIRVGKNSIPAWAFATGDPTLGPVTEVKLRDWDTGGDNHPNEWCGFKYSVASPSDPAFRSLFRRVINALGAHIRSDQRFFSVVAGIKVTGMGMATLENRLPSRCNIAVTDPDRDVAPAGHLVAMSSTNLRPGTEGFAWDNDYTDDRISDVSNCICNPQVLEKAGYTPQGLRDFYAEVEQTIHENFGYKQQIFMNISQGFPRIGEPLDNGRSRFLGDHLVGHITSDLNADPRTYGPKRNQIAQAPAIPGPSDTSQWLIDDGRSAVFAGGNLTIARNFGVENAALDVIGFSVPGSQNASVRCDQQLPISLALPFIGSPAFPIFPTPAENSIDENCPNQMATQEGISAGKVTGFQVTSHLSTGTDIDEALWNMTLNSNGLFFENYEEDHWMARKTQTQWAASNIRALNPHPAVKTETATVNHGSATAKTLEDWNTLLLSRAETFSQMYSNLYEADPFPSSYEVPVESAFNTRRYYFNSRACKAYYEHGTPVHINSIYFLN